MNFYEISSMNYGYRVAAEKIDSLLTVYTLEFKWYFGIKRIVNLSAVFFLWICNFMKFEICFAYISVQRDFVFKYRNQKYACFFFWSYNIAENNQIKIHWITYYKYFKNLVFLLFHSELFHSYNINKNASENKILCTKFFLLTFVSTNYWIQNKKH